MGLLWWLRDKESTCNAGEAEGVGLIPGLGRSPEGKKMAICSSLLAGKNPWVGGLWSMGLKKFRQN